MKVPFSDPRRQYLALRGELETAVARVLASGWYLLGEETRQFEGEFARSCGVKHCIAVANGTDALELALRAAGCAKGSEVITSANAGGYTTIAARIVGAVPTYVDIDPATLLLDIPSTLAAVSPRTRVIVATHLYGRMVDVQALRAGLRDLNREDVVLLEDCAQAHGARVGSWPAGSLGDMAAFSFYPTKNLGSLGDGGALVCNQSDLADRLRELRQYGWGDKYDAVLPYGRNSRLDEIQAAVLRAKLPHLDAWNCRRREIVTRYRNAAPTGLDVLAADGTEHVAHLAVARCAERDRVMRRLAEAGVTTAIHYPVLDCDQGAMQGLPAVVHDLTHTRASVKRILSLPCFPELEDVEIDHVCEQLALLEV